MYVYVYVNVCVCVHVCVCLCVCMCVCVCVMVYFFLHSQHFLDTQASFVPENGDESDVDTLTLAGDAAKAKGDSRKYVAPRFV